MLWHLGAQLWRDRRQIAVNVDGTANVLAGGPRHVVLASSAAVYGAHPDNPVPIRESHPVRPNAECPYAWHKLESERLCRDAAPCAVLRIAAVLGPHADPQVARAAQGYRAVVPAVRGVRSSLQFLDEDDAADAIVAAGLAGKAGTWNLATTDWLDASTIAGLSGGRLVALPRRVVVGGAELAFRLHLLPFGADRSSLLAGPLALDASAAGRDLGWTPALTSAEVLGRALGRS